MATARRSVSTVLAGPVTVTGRSITTATAASASSTSSTATTTLVSKGEVDVCDLLLAVGSLKVDDRFLLVLFFVLLLVDGCLLPLGVEVGALSSLPHVKLGGVLLGLLGLPLVQCEGLGLLRLLLLHGTFLLGLGVLALSSLFHRSVGWFLALGLDVVLKVSPVALPTSTSLVLGLDPSPAVAGLPVKLSLPTATSGSSTASESSRTATSSATSAPSPLSVVVPSHLASLTVALVVPFLSWSVSSLSGVKNSLAFKLVVSLVLLVSIVLVPGLLLGSCLGCRLAGSLDLLCLSHELVGFTGFQDVQRIGLFIQEQSIAISDTYSVGILHVEHLV